MNTLAQFSRLYLDNFLIGIWKAVLGSIVLVSIISVALWALLIVANWNIFTKAEEKGWKSIIPIYSDYVRFKLTWKTMYFWLLLLLEVVDIAIAVIQNYNESLTWLSYVSIVIDVGALVIYVISLYKLSKSFGHGAGFTIGLVFLPNIFTLIIAFGSSKYQKIEEIK